MSNKFQKEKNSSHSLNIRKEQPNFTWRFIILEKGSIAVIHTMEFWQLLVNINHRELKCWD